VDDVLATELRGEPAREAVARAGEVALQERAADDHADRRSRLSLVARGCFERALERLQRGRSGAEAIERTRDETLDARAIVAFGRAACLREIAQRITERLACAAHVA